MNQMEDTDSFAYAVITDLASTLVTESFGADQLITYAHAQVQRRTCKALSFIILGSLGCSGMFVQRISFACPFLLWNHEETL